jgi:hypothetical protein
MHFSVQLATTRFALGELSQDSYKQVADEQGELRYCELVSNGKDQGHKTGLFWGSRLVRGERPIIPKISCGGDVLSGPNHYSII